jgi:hypothetical protein
MTKMTATTTLDRFQLTSWPVTMRTPQEMAARPSTNTAVLTTRSME